MFKWIETRRLKKKARYLDAEITERLDKIKKFRNQSGGDMLHRLDQELCTVSEWRELVILIQEHNEVYEALNLGTSPHFDGKKYVLSESSPKATLTVSGRPNPVEEITFPKGVSPESPWYYDAEFDARLRQWKIDHKAWWDITLPPGVRMSPKAMQKLREKQKAEQDGTS